jgi:phosphoadenosine phosphosulfate reductase
MALKIRKDIQIFSLDTGRLYPETYQFIEKVRKHYKVDIELLSPDYTQLETFVKEKGLFSFYSAGTRLTAYADKSLLVQSIKRHLVCFDIIPNLCGALIN